MKMKLSQVNPGIFSCVVRDGEFESLGFITHNLKAMLVFIEDMKFLPKLLQNQRVSCVITSKELVNDLPEEVGVAISEYPRKAFYEFHNFIAKETDFYWSHFPADISPKARIHPTAYITDKDVRIGDDVIVEPNVTILERVVIEDNVIIRAGSIIGSEGFEFNAIDGRIVPVAHAGGVLIHKGAEIQASCCVDKSVFGGFTEIGEDTKLDNKIHIAHNVKIGKRCRLAACTMIAGSVTIGDDVWVGPGVSVSSEINIGNDAYITLGSVVTKDVAPGQRVTGNFAIEHRKFIEFIKSIR